MQYLDFFCLGFCFIHMIVSFIVSFFEHKKINSVCKKCLSPLVEGEVHQCSDVLSEDQLQLLVAFVSSLKNMEVR